MMSLDDAYTLKQNIQTDTNTKLNLCGLFNWLIFEGEAVPCL